MNSPAAQLDQAERRGGFTMLELLIVLMIITIIASISFAVYGAAVENAREAATKATLRQLDSALQERLNAFQRVSLRSQAQQFKFAYDANRPMGASRIPLELAELLIRKDRFKAAFPQREEDLWGLNGVQENPPTIGDDSPLLKQMWDSSTATWKTDSWKGRDGASIASAKEAAESSELLYVALTAGPVFAGAPLALDRITSRHIGDTDQDGNPEFLDEWGQPLRFYNWTTSLVRPAGTTSPIDRSTFRASVSVLMPGTSIPSADPLTTSVLSDRLNQDPDDPTGALYAGLLSSDSFFANPFSLGSTSGQPFSEALYHAPDTYSLPLIVSAGGDRTLGLHEPTEAGRERLARPIAVDATDTRIDQLTDNLTNRQP